MDTCHGHGLPGLAGSMCASESEPPLDPDIVAAKLFGELSSALRRWGNSVGKRTGRPKQDG